MFQFIKTQTDESKSTARQLIRYVVVNLRGIFLFSIKVTSHWQHNQFMSVCNWKTTPTRSSTTFFVQQTLHFRVLRQLLIHYSSLSRQNWSQMELMTAWSLKWALVKRISSYWEGSIEALLRFDWRVWRTFLNNSENPIWRKNALFVVVFETYP